MFKEVLFVTFDMQYVELLCKRYMKQHDLDQSLGVTPNVKRAVLHILGVDTNSKMTTHEGVIRCKNNKRVGRKTTLLSAPIRQGFPYALAYKSRFEDNKDVFTSDEVGGELVDLSTYGLEWHTKAEKDFELGGI